MKKTNIGFLGLGLIGGSIARAIKAKNPDTIIQVYSRRKNLNLEQGKTDGIIDEIHYNIDEHFSSCDFIFLCAPVLKNIDFLQILKPLIKQDCILTDVGSVKGNIHTAVRELEMDHFFIGGHPMAGSEKTGYENSSVTLLKDCYYLLTPTPQTSVEQMERLKKLLSCTDSNFVVINPKEHDEVTAAISHLPHIIATTLVTMIQDCDSSDEKMKNFAAGGFRDVTRIAASSPDMWESICVSNEKSIDYFLTEYIKYLNDFRKLIKSKDKESIKHFFENARDYRTSIQDKRDDS